jgi:hypothetical protein
MRTKASRMKIVRRAAGVPPGAIAPTAEVLDCAIHRWTPADQKWLEEYTRKRGKPWSRRVRLRQDALRPFWGKALISACIMVESSVFEIFVDPKAQAIVFWEERRRHPSGRITTRCTGPAAPPPMPPPPTTA